jgi:endonuclease III
MENMHVQLNHITYILIVPFAGIRKYLLSVNGLGAKSVDCIRLLSLNHKAFPVSYILFLKINQIHQIVCILNQTCAHLHSFQVDVNVARIVTRLEWVELQCCDEEFHLVDL